MRAARLPHDWARALLAALLAVLLLGGGRAQVLTAEAALPARLAPGEAASVALEVAVDDPAAQLQQGVLFLNVVADDPSAGFPQMAHRLFAAAAEEPPVFRRLLSGAELRSGVSTRLAFELSRRAPAGRYLLVVQLFSSATTNPHRVRLEDRVGMQSFPFTVSP